MEEEGERGCLIFWISPQQRNMSHFDKIQINGKEHFPLFMELKTMVSVLFNFKRSLWNITFIVQSRMIWLCKHNRHWHKHDTGDLHHTTNLWATKQSTTTPKWSHNSLLYLSFNRKEEKKVKKFNLLHKILLQKGLETILQLPARCLTLHYSWSATA